VAWIRARVAHVAVGWLVFQLCLLASVPTVLCSPDPNAIALEAACTCGHADAEGQSCPMHHPSTSPSTDCSCRSTTDPRAAIVASLIGPIAVLAPVASPMAPATVAAPARVVSADPLEFAVVPDSPPPRV
jgi:hypothetical protein